MSTDQQRSILIPGNEELQIQKSLRLRDGFVQREPEVMNSKPGCSHEVMDPGDHGNDKQTRGSKGGNIVTEAMEIFPSIPAIADKQVGGDTVFVDVNASEDDFYSESNDDDSSLDGTDASSSDESEESEDELIDEVGDIPTHQQQQSVNEPTVTISNKTRIAMDPEVRLVVSELVQEGIKKGIQEYKELESKMKKASKSLGKADKLLKTTTPQKIDNLQSCNSVGNQVKLPSDTTLYRPALN